MLLLIQLTSGQKFTPVVNPQLRVAYRETFRLLVHKRSTLVLTVRIGPIQRVQYKYLQKNASPKGGEFLEGNSTSKRTVVKNSSSEKPKCLVE